MAANNFTLPIDVVETMGRGELDCADECEICLDTFTADKPTLTDTKCRNVFCRDCLIGFIDLVRNLPEHPKPKCPKCRRVFRYEDDIIRRFCILKRIEDFNEGEPRTIWNMDQYLVDSWFRGLQLSLYPPNHADMLADQDDDLDYSTIENHHLLRDMFIEHGVRFWRPYVMDAHQPPTVLLTPFYPTIQVAPLHSDPANYPDLGGLFRHFTTVQLALELIHSFYNPLKGHHLLNLPWINEVQSWALHWVNQSVDCVSLLALPIAAAAPVVPADAE